MSDTNTKTTEPRVGWWLAVVLVGMIGMQVFRNSSAGNAAKTPGQERGDLVLTEDSLPANIESWQRTRFEPPLPPEELPENQYWWTHSWQYQRSGATALVSFDQADWHGWHELTECYLANGWTMDQRTTGSDLLPPDKDWSYVCASLKRSDTDRCLVVFSMFFEGGNPVEPRGSLFGQRYGDDTFAERMQRRAEYNPAAAELTGMRAFQCQVYAPFRGNLTDEFTSQVIKLHTEARLSIVELHNRKRAATAIAK
jgi:hypothetical protein